MGQLGNHRVKVNKKYETTPEDGKDRLVEINRFKSNYMKNQGVYENLLAVKSREVL